VELFKVDVQTARAFEVYFWQWGITAGGNYPEFPDSSKRSKNSVVRKFKITAVLSHIKTDSIKNINLQAI